MVEAEFAPPFCQRLRAIREAKKKEAQAAGDTGRARELTQEGMAKAIGVTLKAYRAYEKDREPDHLRRRDIARALEMEQADFEAETLISKSTQFEALRRELLREMAELRQAGDKTAQRLDDALRERQALAPPREGLPGSRQPRGSSPGGRSRPRG